MICFIVLSVIAFNVGKNIQELRSEGSDMYVIQKIEEFNKKNGHYPIVANSNELTDSLGLNLNYVSPELFTYDLDTVNDYYIVKVFYFKDSLYYSYDSRIGKIIYEKKSKNE